jgi:hypothetical protein
MESASYTLQDLPLGVPIGIDGKVGDLINRYCFAASKLPTIAIVEEIKNKSYSLIPEKNIHRLVRLSALHPNGRRWSNPADLWIPKNSTFVPFEKKTQERIGRLKEKYTQTHLGQKFTAGTSTSGADPEIFVVDKITGKVIPAFAFLPDKKQPLIFFDSSDYRITAFWDGFQAEFTTRAFGCMQEMCRSLQSGLLETLRQAKAKFPNAILSPESVVEIDSEILQTIPDHHAALGCSRSENAYGTPHIQVENPRMLPFRFAGGHMHFGENGIAAAPDEKIIEWVRVLDSLVGVASVLWFQGMENPIRRQFYGRAGEYRRPKHGLEYRTLGNAWLRHPAIFHLVYGFARTSLQFARSGLAKYMEVCPEQVKEVIDSYDIKGAKEIVQKNKAVFKSILNHSHDPKPVASAMKALQGGLGEFMSSPDNIEKNWRNRLEWWEAGNFISRGMKI